MTEPTNRPTTHIAYPVEVAEAIRKTLVALPYEQVEAIITAMRNSGVPMNIAPPESAEDSG